MKTTSGTSLVGLSFIVNTGATARSVPETTSHDVIYEPVLSRSAEGVYQTKVGFKKS